MIACLRAAPPAQIGCMKSTAGAQVEGRELGRHHVALEPARLRCLCATAAQAFSRLPLAAHAPDQSQGSTSGTHSVLPTVQPLWVYMKKPGK